MSTYNTQTIDEAELEEQPKFYRSISDSFTTDRLGRGISVGSRIFPIEDILDIEMEIEIGAASSTFKTVSHKVGYKPQILGMYYLESVGNRRVFGDVIDPDFIYGGQVWIEDYTIDTVKIGANVYFLAGGDPVTETIILKLYLLGVEAI